jgi:hypothetical protein
MNLDNPTPSDQPLQTPLTSRKDPSSPFLPAFRRRQCSFSVFVTLANQALSFTNSKSSGAAKYLTLFGGAFPNRFSKRAETKIGTSCA